MCRVYRGYWIKKVQYNLCKKPYPPVRNIIKRTYGGFGPYLCVSVFFGIGGGEGGVFWMNKLSCPSTETSFTKGNVSYVPWQQYAERDVGRECWELSVRGSPRENSSTKGSTSGCPIRILPKRGNDWRDKPNGDPSSLNSFWFELRIWDTLDSGVRLDLLLVSVDLLKFLVRNTPDGVSRMWFARCPSGTP